MRNCPTICWLPGGKNSVRSVMRSRRLVLPPIGLVWYVVVVSSGIENLHATTRRRAFAATLIPMLLAVNIALGVTYAVL